MVNTKIYLPRNNGDFRFNLSQTFSRRKNAKFYFCLEKSVLLDRPFCFSKVGVILVCSCGLQRSGHSIV